MKKTSCTLHALLRKGALSPALSESQSTQIEWLHLLRIVSIFCMMVLHISANQWYTVSIETTAWHVLNIYDSLVRFCVPVLFMLSGAMLLDPERECSIKKLWSKKIFRLATAFAFWSAAYAVSSALVRYRALHAESLSNILKNFLHGHYHMWFLFAIVGLYIMTPFLRLICQNRRLMQYFLIVWFVFTSIGSLMDAIPALKILGSFLNHNYLPVGLGFSGYYIVGYYLRTQSISKRRSLLIYTLGIVALLFTIFGTALLSLHTGKANELFYTYLFPNICLISVSVFLLFKQMFEHRRFSGKASRLLTLISKRSFGMYLVHDFFNILLAQFLHITALSFCPIISVPILSLLVFTGSLILTCILAKIPLLNRYII